MSGWRHVLFSTLLCVPSLYVTQSGNRPVSATKSSMLFCAYGSYSVVSKQYHPTVVVTVVDVYSERKLERGGISEVTLIASSGQATTMTRLVNVEVFGEPHLPHESYGKYYLDTNPSGTTRRWNGILPAGDIRLRIRAEVSNLASNPERCRVRVGPYVIEGPVNFGPWAQ